MSHKRAASDSNQNPRRRLNLESSSLSRQTSSTAEEEIGIRLAEMRSSSLDKTGSSFRSLSVAPSEVPIEDADEGITKSEIVENKRQFKRAMLMLRPSDAQKEIDSLRVEVKGFCRVSVLKPSKEGGYVQLSGDGANKYAVLHEVLLWAKGEEVQHGVDHISHLCDEPRCTIKEHVVVESPQVNNSRKNCGMILDCAHCPKKYQACKHTPRCITYVEGFESWQHFVDTGLHK